MRAVTARRAVHRGGRLRFGPPSLDEAWVVEREPGAVFGGELLANHCERPIRVGREGRQCLGGKGSDDQAFVLRETMSSNSSGNTR